MSRAGWRPLAVILGALAVLAALLIPLLRPAPALAWSVTGGCDENGNVAGSIGHIPGPYPSTFDVYVKDHRPGESTWVEVPGSRQTVVANSSTIAFGPLDV